MPLSPLTRVQLSFNGLLTTLIHLLHVIVFKYINIICKGKINFERISSQAIERPLFFFSLLGYCEGEGKCVGRAGRTRLGCQRHTKIQLELEPPATSSTMDPPSSTTFRYQSRHVGSYVRDGTFLKFEKSRTKRMCIYIYM